MRIAITGATGFVGTKLVERLLAQGDTVIILARNSQKAQRQFPVSVFPNVLVVPYTLQELGEWTNALSGSDGVVNLAGAPIAGQPWTAKRKQEILQSRQLGTRQLVEAIKSVSPKPKVLVSGSAIGYYGTDEIQTFDEHSLAGNDFLAEVCKTWEAEAEAVEPLGVRLVKLRTGIVLGHGGVLAKILPLFELGLGGKLGSGRQWFSWIHRDDLVNAIVFALTNAQISGPLNGTAPNPVTNQEFTQALARALKRPAFLPVPAAVLKLLLGEASILILEGQRVLPERAKLNYFQFQYPTIDVALGQIVANG